MSSDNSTRGSLARPEQAPALVIIPYFGTFGPWFPLFLHSLACQHTLDLLLITDAACPPLPPNARRVQMTLAEVRELATARLGTRVRLSNTRKLCDLKPAYGLVFGEFARGYAYWAFGDEDVLYGDVDSLVAPHLLRELDLVVPSKTMTVGHLTLVRNAPLTNALPMGDATYQAVLASEEHWAYDESSWARGTDSSSFTRVVKDAETRGALRVHWGFSKRGDVPCRGVSYVYDGIGIHENDGSEVTYYHWGRFRGLGHAFPTMEQAGAGFAFDRYGFFRRDLGPVRQRVRRVLGSSRELAGQIGQRLGRHRPR
jgi:hypothetical protein